MVVASTKSVGWGSTVFFRNLDHSVRNLKNVLAVIQRLSAVRPVPVAIAVPCKQSCRVVLLDLVIPTYFSSLAFVLIVPRNHVTYYYYNANVRTKHFVRSEFDILEAVEKNVFRLQS